MSKGRLRIGYIPLVDAAALIVAVDCGFAEAEGLAIDLAREVSWSNVRDKLNIGLFDAAHLLSPMAIASRLGIGHVRVPLIAPYNLGLNGNAITVSPRLHAALSAAADGDLADAKVSSRALARVLAERRDRNAEPLTFGMTFPFSNHNYQLRFWMAAGGIDPDEDVRLVVLPPPYMVESLANGHVDGFCVGAPWNSVAVDLGVGHILHFGCEIMANVSEKVLAVHERWANDNSTTLDALIRALDAASKFIGNPENHNDVAAVLKRRLDVDAGLLARTLAGHLKIAPDGAARASDRYIVFGSDHAGRPEPLQAAWLYAQIARWKQAPLTEQLLTDAEQTFRPDLYDAALGRAAAAAASSPVDGIGAFAGPAFDPRDIASYLDAWQTRRSGRPRLTVVR